MTYGLGEKADGVFVVVDLKVRSAKDESVTLTDNAFQLEVNGKTYEAPTRTAPLPPLVPARTRSSLRTSVPTPPRAARSSSTCRRAS